MRRLPLIVIAFVAVMAMTLTAQRRITPVTATPAAGKTVEPEKTDTAVFDPSRFVHFHDAEGNVVLVDTVTGREVADTTLSANNDTLPKMQYPLWYSASIGVDLWDPVMRAFGQHYGLIGFSAGVNLHNRYRPVIEIGLGNASYTPDDGNYTYKGKMAPYFKIGMDYNFLYNSNPSYEAYAGIRFGVSRFSYELTDITVNSPYWDETTQFNIPSQSVTASYFEFLFGIKVRVWRGISLGWTLRYHSIMSDGNPRYGDPWYIPGYGSRGGAWAGGFSIYYTILLNKRHTPAVGTVTEEPIHSEPLHPSNETTERQ